MRKLKENVKLLKSVSYFCGLVIIIGTIIYGTGTIGKELLNSSSSPEKKIFLESLVAGLVLMFEGRMLTDIHKDQGKTLFLMIIGAVCIITLIINTVWSGIGQYFNVYGIMDLAFCIINIFILSTVLNLREKSRD